MTNKVKPNIICNNPKNQFDQIPGPSGHEQIYNRQYYKRVKSNKSNGHSNNMADQIL